MAAITFGRNERVITGSRRTMRAGPAAGRAARLPADCITWLEWASTGLSSTALNLRPRPCVGAEGHNPCGTTWDAAQAYDRARDRRATFRDDLHDAQVVLDRELRTANLPADPAGPEVPEPTGPELDTWLDKPSPSEEDIEAIPAPDLGPTPVPTPEPNAAPTEADR